ncbi:type IX secretion system outer membrane channel protein PorV [Epilithonimonas sp.]|uniref:type IX secretion system outer membrane channel protein PorV n=1 Tax=Epilithonimonas sp. TaxID=2894511 RepID=UPI00289B6BC9|nr:type IX secretion system outer membrane channel protein PorV [Epilithonimonas sp.]
MNLTKLFLGLGIGVSAFAFSQSNNTVLTGAPFLRISPDARAGGMGDQGVVTSTDVFSQFWNAAKYPFAKVSSGVGVNYTPYMSKLTNDVFLLYGSFYTFLGDDERSTLSASLYYFNMGEVSLTDIKAGTIIDNGTVKPNEFSIDLAYGLKLSDTYSMAVTGRFIRSDFGSFNSDSNFKAANTFAVDVSGYFVSPKHESISGYEGRVKAGWAVQNIGPKLDYTGDENSRSYLPTMARLGIGYDLLIDDMNRFSLSGEASKILVPAPDSETQLIPNVGPIEGIGKSFSNKKSIMFSGAAEYSYDDTFAIRTGYFAESPEQGARQYATVGVGFKYASFGLDLSYLINTSKINTALDNTLRFGLTWNIGSETYNATDY